MNKFLSNNKKKKKKSNEQRDIVEQTLSSLRGRYKNSEKVRQVFLRSSSSIGRSEFILKGLAEFFGGLGHVLTLPCVHLRTYVLHRWIWSPHGITAAKLWPWNSYTLNIAQPRFHYSFRKKAKKWRVFNVKHFTFQQSIIDEAELIKI